MARELSSKLEILMDHCQKQRIKMNVLHTVLSGAGAVLCFFGAQWGAAHFGYPVTQNELLIGSGLFAALTWLASSPMFKFTEECMNMKSASEDRRIKPTPSKPGAKPTITILPAASEKRIVVKPAAAVKAAPPAAPSEMTAGGKLFDRGRVTIAVIITDGNRTVNVTTRGLSNSDFKGSQGLRSRLESIPGISWANPKNEGNGVRSMQGTIVAGAKDDDIANRLKTVAERVA
jgi:hypothetical protein